jgi:hypothetical protein
MLNKAATIAVVAAIAVFLSYLFVRAYKPEWFEKKQEPFVVKAVPVVTSPQIETIINSASSPSKAEPVLADLPAGPERVVMPGGPGAPNAKPPPIKPRISPDAVPLDPYDQKNMEAPIEDTMRYPERSFGPGTVNDSTQLSTASGVASTAMNSALGSFSPEFAQNGGTFMGSVFANDLNSGDEFASA